MSAGKTICTPVSCVPSASRSFAFKRTSCGSCTVRISTRFELAIEPRTESAIKAMAKELPVVSAERIAEELRQLLVHPRRTHGLNLLMDLGLAAAIMPELLAMKGLPQGLPSQPTGDLWDHVMRMLDLLGPAPSFPLAFATLLHDIGKPNTMDRTPERYTFYHHEHIGARMAGDIAKRLKLSNAERDRFVWLVEKHQYLANAREMRPSKLKVILSNNGIQELLALHRADALASGKSIDHVEYCEQLLREWTPADLNPPPFITGHDLMTLGVEPGPLFKRMLDAVRDALDGTVQTRNGAGVGAAFDRRDAVAVIPAPSAAAIWAACPPAGGPRGTSSPQGRRCRDRVSRTRSARSPTDRVGDAPTALPSEFALRRTPVRAFGGWCRSAVPGWPARCCSSGEAQASRLIALPKSLIACSTSK